MHYRSIFLAFIGLVFFAFNAKSQSYFGSAIDIDTSRNAELHVKGLAFYQATTLNRAFLQPFIQGGELSSEIINDRYFKQNDFNTVGLSLQGEVSLKLHHANFGKQNKYGFMVSAGAKTIGSIAYSKDLFGLVFKGNSESLGDSLNMNSSSMQFESFHKIGFGLFNRNTNTFFRLNFVGSTQSVNAYVGEGDFYSSSNGDSLALSMDGVLKYNAASSFYKAYGASIDFQYNMPFGNTEDKFRGVLSFSVSDLGLMHAGNLSGYDLDTTISFSGANFDNVRSLFGMKGNEILDSLGIEKTRTSALRFLPTTLEVAKRVELDREDKWQSIFGLRLYPTIVSIPQAYAGAHYRINEVFSAGARVSYGGFGAFRTGAYFRMHKSDFDFYLSSQDLVGLVSKKGLGNSLQFGLGWYL